MFSKTGRFYDKIYFSKNYRAEVDALTRVLYDHIRSGGNLLLDVACGTGVHLSLLREHFEGAGLDLDAVLLDVARNRNPGAPFYHADMIDFELGRRFDAVINLFSSIGYVGTVENLHRAIAAMARHLKPGGVLVVEPWFAPDQWKTGMVHATLVDEPDLKIARVSTSLAHGTLSYFDLHYLIATPEGTQHSFERHEMGLFTSAQMIEAFDSAGLETAYDAKGLTGRGL